LSIIFEHIFIYIFKFLFPTPAVKKENEIRVSNYKITVISNATEREETMGHYRQIIDQIRKDAAARPEWMELLQTAAECILRAADPLRA